MYATLYRNFLCAVLLLFTLSLSAQPETEQTDQYIASLRVDANISVKELAALLTREAATDHQKARAIYKWMTANIVYDTQAYESRRITDQEPDVVLLKRTAICSGYARLFKALCDAVNIRCEVVSGYAKANDYQIGQAVDEPNHAWNAVFVDAKWQLVDVTWGAGGRNKQPGDYYFLTPPHQMIYSHLPEDARWQLLNQKVSLYEFEHKLLVYPDFFACQLENLNFREPLISTNKSSLLLSFTAPRGYLFSPSLEEEGEMIDLSRNTRRRGNEVVVRVEGLQPNHTYKLHLFGIASDTGRVLNLLTTYFISTGSQVKYYAAIDAEFKLESYSNMPYWFVAQYQEYLDKENYKAIEELIKANLVRYSANKWLHLKLGYAYEMQNRPTQAIESYRKAIAIDANYFEAHYSLGVLYYNEAVNVYEKIRRMSRQEYQQKGNDYLNRVTGYFSKAKPYFQKALVLKSNDEQIRSALVNIDRFVK